MRKVFFLIILSVFSCAGFPVAGMDDSSPKMVRTADNGTDANLMGHVVDKATGEHLPFIYLVVKGTTISTSTDQTGHYFLKNLPEGEFVVEVAAMGYRSVSQKVSFRKGYTVELNFELQEDKIALDGVVVSANRSETTRRMAPTLVNVMTMELYDQVNACKLSQGLSFQPGVRVENNCQNCGFQQIRINGLDGPYTQILIDSRPVFSALAGVYGIEQLPANMIDRVEVMRGGGSALFGSSAIAGTVNVITKEPVRNSASLSHNFMNYDAKKSFENTTSLNASLVTDNNKMGIAVFGQNRQFGGYDNDGDGFTELAKINSQTLGFRAYVKTSLYSKITAEYHHMNEYRRGGNKLDLPPHEADIAEDIKHSINSGGLKFDWFSKNERHRVNVFASIQDIDRNSYYGVKQNLKAYGKSDNTTWVAGGQYIYKFNKCLFMPADLTAGVEFNQDRLKDAIEGYDRHTSQTVNIISGYLQNEWKNEKWGVLIGGRLDKHNLIKNVIFSPRANLRYNPVKNINLRATYAYGFRAPQTFDEDLHVESVGGNMSMIKLADDLRVEKSQSVSLSADMYGYWGDWQGNLLLEGFYNDLKDVFTLVKLGLDDRGVLMMERRNEKGARVFGGNIEGKIAWKDKIQLQAGATFQSARYKVARQWAEDVEPQKKMFRTPDIYGYFTFTYNPIQRLMLALSGVYTGSMLVEHHAGAPEVPNNLTVKTPDFMEVNFKAAYDIALYKGINLQVNAGVQNIFDSYQRDFDKGVDRDSGYMYGPTAPRCFFVGVKLSY